MKKIFWKLCWRLRRKYWRRKIKKEMGEIPKPEGKPIEWRRLRTMDEIKPILTEEEQKRYEGYTSMKDILQTDDEKKEGKETGMDIVKFIVTSNLKVKKKILSELEGFLKDEPTIEKGFCYEEVENWLKRRLEINPSEVRLFYNLLNKEIQKEEKIMDEKPKTAVEAMEEERKMREQITRSPFVPARLLSEDDLPKAAKRMICLYDTSDLMVSMNYKERFVAEYYQTKIRYEKLKAFNNRIEAARITNLCYLPDEEKRASKVEMPKHDCPDDLLLSQQHIMGEYLHTLELRAEIEGINLDAYK